MAVVIVGALTASVTEHPVKSRLKELHLSWRIDDWTVAQAKAKRDPQNIPGNERWVLLFSPEVPSEQLGSSSKGRWQMKISLQKREGRAAVHNRMVISLALKFGAAEQGEIATAQIVTIISTDSPAPRNELCELEQDEPYTWDNNEYFSDHSNVLSDCETVRQIVEAKSLLLEYTLTFRPCPYRDTFTCMPCSKLAVGNGMLNLYNSQTLTDFVFVSSDNKELHVHRSVLAISCEAFRAMLTHDTKEKRTGVCELVDIDYETLRVIVDSFYGVEILPRVLGGPAAVYRAADKYDLGKLKDVCRRPLETTLTVKNVVDRYLFGQQDDLPDLIEKCLEYVRDHYDEFLDHGGVHEASEKLPGGYVEFLKMVGAGTPAKRQRTK